jgi:hypothetical protein
MSEPKSTNLTIREDRSTAISSSAYGANLNAVGFNIAFLAARNPKLAVDILRLYTLAHEVQQDDPTAPDEDFALFADAVKQTLEQDKDS